MGGEKVISILRGELAFNGGRYAVIDCGGVGYYVHIPSCVGCALPQIGERCTLFTIFHISKTDVSLVGFLTQEQRECYQMLTSVSGAGEKAGLEILGALDVHAVYRAILTENVEMLTHIKGIGKKLAQRIILECRDKVGKAGQNDSTEEITPNMGTANSTMQSAVEALISLGYKRKEALSTVSDMDPTLPLETIIPLALKKLSM